MTIEKAKNTVGIFGFEVKGFGDFKNINILIEKNKSIRITGARLDSKFNREAKTFNEKAWIPFDLTFNVGDTAIYDSYNFDYTNPIKSIGEKTIAFEGRRLDLTDFILHNYDYCPDKIQRRRASWSD
jgi:hypothetical protein